MTPERKLIEAVICEWEEPSVTSIDYVLATPSVQTALAEVRSNIRNPDATDEDPMVRDVEAWLAANPPATPKPEPVLRWEGDKLMMGAEQVASTQYRLGRGCRWETNLGPYGEEGHCTTLTEARTAAEQAVRDWLKRAGCV